MEVGIGIVRDDLGFLVAGFWVVVMFIVNENGDRKIFRGYIYSVMGLRS